MQTTTNRFESMLAKGNVQSVEKVVYTRSCLKCNKKFRTDSPFLRLCPQCRSKAKEYDLTGYGFGY